MSKTAEIQHHHADWAHLYNEAELYKAAIRLYTKPLFDWRKAQSTSTDERTLYDFARRGLKNLQVIHSQLASRTFHFRPGLALHHNFNGKHRTLYIYPWEERLVDLLLYRILNRRFNRWFSPHSYAYRLDGWGLDRCQRRLARIISKANGPIYTIKRDISDYFGSIDHEVLQGLIDELVPPGDYLSNLLRERIKFRYVDHGTDGTAGQGIPFGTAVACFFANAFLTRLDRRLESIPEVFYFRYADDLLALSENRDSTVAAANIVDEELLALRLKSNSKHEHEFTLTRDSKGDERFRPLSHFRHLGLDFRAGGTVGLSRDKTRKIQNLFRYAFRRRAGTFRRLKDPVKKAQLAIDLSKKVLDTGLRNVGIIDYYLRHVCEEDQLQMIDRWLAEETLSLAFGGHRKSNFRKMPFSRLRSMGLPSLVQRRRLITHGHLESTFFVWKSNMASRRTGARAARPAGGLSARSKPVFSSCPEAAAQTCS